MKRIISCGGLTLALLITPSLAADPARSYDVVVYGGTASGVVAALQASKMGKTTAIIEPTKHLGGMTTGGLGATDIGNKAAIGGLAREFYKRLGKHYGQDEAWKFEPHVAQALIKEMVRESKADVFLHERLKSVKMDGPRIVSVTTTGGTTLAGKMFIDASYEGDLMAMAGVSYTVGRESNSKYGETLNGVQFGQRHHQFDVPVDPYVIEGDPSSGLLARIHGGDPGKHGQGDHRVQAYCFRMCLTQDPNNRIPFPKPEGYDPKQYELLIRYLQKAEAAGVKVPLMNHVMMPNGKTDTNNHGGFSTDNIGYNYEYPDGYWPTRERIIKEHEVYQKGVMWTLANDPRIPERIRKEVGSWGLAKDEFVDNGNWPHQLYIREARRMIGELVTTQHHCEHEQIEDDPVGMGAYQMDSHNCQRFAKDGRVLNEGDVQVPPAAPYGISFRSIVPRASECQNLAVPVCLSASHIAYGSIRMEPVFMILGQSSATAACMAIDDGISIQQVPYAKLRDRLLADGQVLKWTGPVRKPGITPGPDMVDDSQAKLTGRWVPAMAVGGYVGRGYLHDANTDKGAMSARFILKIEKAGRYRVQLKSLPNPNRATNVPVTIRHAEGEAKVTVNQRSPKPEEREWALLGEYRFEPGKEAWVEISNKDTDGHVIVDAVRLVAVP